MNISLIATLVSNHMFHNGQQTHHAQGDFLRLLQSEGGGSYKLWDAESESAALKSIDQLSAPWQSVLSLYLCYSRIALELMIPLSACRQAAVMSPSQRPRWEQGHPCCQHKALCHRGVTAGCASLLPHCARLCVCVCMHWKHCSYCLLMSFFFTSSRHDSKQCRTK